MNSAASIKDLLAQASKKRTPKVKCNTCKWLMSLDPEEMQLVQEAIYSNEWELTVLLQTLRPAGLTVKKEAFHYHARAKHQIPTD